MDNKYIKINIFPIITEVLFVLACLLFQGYYIYINFLFYIILAIYFWLGKDFLIKEWIASIKGGDCFLETGYIDDIILLSCFRIYKYLRKYVPIS